MVVLKGVLQGRFDVLRAVKYGPNGMAKRFRGAPSILGRINSDAICFSYEMVLKVNGHNIFLKLNSH
jgi:hypothetical protein